MQACTVQSFLSKRYIWMFSKRLFWKISTFGVQVKPKSEPDPYFKTFWRVFLLASFPLTSFLLASLPLARFLDALVRVPGQGQLRPETRLNYALDPAAGGLESRRGRVERRAVKKTGQCGTVGLRSGRRGGSCIGCQFHVGRCPSLGGGGSSLVTAHASTPPTSIYLRDVAESPPESAAVFRERKRSGSPAVVVWTPERALEPPQRYKPSAPGVAGVLCEPSAPGVARADNFMIHKTTAFVRCICGAASSHWCNRYRQPAVRHVTF